MIIGNLWHGMLCVGPEFSNPGQLDKIVSTATVHVDASVPQGKVEFDCGMHSKVNLHVPSAPHIPHM